MPKFIVKEGAEPSSEIPMNTPQLVFGRTEECDVIVNDPNVSRKHAQALNLDGLTAMMDLNSSNGTYVNGLPISRIFLMDGDEIRLGSTVLVFSDDEEIVPSAGGGKITASISPKASGIPAEQGDLGHTLLFAAVPDDMHVDALKEIYLKLKTLYRVFHEVAQSTTLRDVFDAIARAATISASAERVIFFLNAEKSGGTWQQYFTHTASRLGEVAAAKPHSEAVLERVRNDQALVLAKSLDNGRVEFKEEEPDIVAIPLVRAGRISAVVYVDCPESRRGLSKNDIDFISTLGLQVAIRMNQVEQVTQLKQENVQLRRQIDEDFAVIAHSDKMKQIMAVTERVAASDATVLVTGESGTGKELVARSIHKFSRRGQKPLVAVNCAALPETLLESELFGHEKGAFTGAVERRIGKFELADGGTLFLDEIGDISAAAQAKLLRALQEGEIQRVGGNKVVKVDVRMITATNKNLLEEVRKGNFRQDLFFRLKVIEIVLPPLRDRNEDIPVLAEYFLKQLRSKHPTTAQRFAPETIKAMMNYSFPGNIRELRNVVERALVFAFGDVILPEHLPMEVFADQPPDSAVSSATNAPLLFAHGGTPLSLTEVEKQHIHFVLKHVKGNKLKAAQVLGISRTTLYEKLKTYGLTADADKPED